MAKTKISEFSSTPGNNTDIDGINIAEGCAPSGINDAIRELMSQLKDFQTGSAGDSFNGPVGTTTAAAGAFTTLSASSTVSGTGFSTYLASPPAIGGTAAAAGAFTTLSASSTVSGTGFSTYLASPPAIGGTAAAAGSFTTLSASSTVTLSGGTANGVLYLNGSKVATSGTALTFDGTNFGIGTSSPSSYGKLAVFGARTTSSGEFLGGLNVSDTTTGGAAGVGGVLTFGGDTQGAGTKQFAAVLGGKENSTLTDYAGYLAFYSRPGGGSLTERARIDSSGNLGIGTSSPAQRLEVFGASSGAANTYIRVTANIASGYEAGLQFFRNGGSIVNAQIAATTEVGNDYGKLTFSTANSGTLYERMRLDSSGNLGLGVTPSAWLSGAKAIQIGAGGYVDSRGSVNLDIGSNAYIDSAAAWRYISTGEATQTRMDSGAFAWLIAASGTAGNTISWTQAMTLDASGNVQIGTTTSNGRLSVDQGSTGTAGYFTTSGSTGTVILSDTGGNGAGIKFVGNGATTPNKYIRTNAGVLEFVNSAYSAVFANFTDAGAAYNTTGTWGTISDLRIKENVSTARNYLADLCRLRVVKYSLKSEKATSATKLGFIAQEVEEVFPNLVETSKNDFEGLDDMKQIKMSVLTPMLLKAVQELKAELDAVKAELATLKGA